MFDFWRLVFCGSMVLVLCASGPAALARDDALCALDLQTHRLYFLRPAAKELCCVDLDTSRIERSTALAGRPAALAVSPSGGELYLAEEDAVRIYSLQGLAPKEGLPLPGARWIAAGPAERLVAWSPSGEAQVCQTRPFRVQKTLRLEPDRLTVDVNAAALRECGVEGSPAYAPRVLRVDWSRQRLHAILGRPLGKATCEESIKPVDCWVVADLATGAVLKRLPVLAPCDDLALDAAGTKGYALSRGFNADHVVVLDLNTLAVERYIPLEPYEAQNLDRIAMAPDGMLACFSSWNPEDLVFVRSEAAVDWGPQDPVHLGVATTEPGRVRDMFAWRRRTDDKWMAQRKAVVAHTVSLWQLRGPYQRVLTAPWNGNLYMPGEQGVIVIDREHLGKLQPATMLPQRFDRQAPPNPRAWDLGAPYRQRDHNTLAPEHPLSFEEDETDAPRIQKYQVPDRLGIFPIRFSPPSAMRKDRPRLFVTPDELPALRAKLLGPMREQFDRYRKQRVHGQELYFQAALGYLVTEEQQYLDRARAILDGLIAAPKRPELAFYSYDCLSPLFTLYDWCYHGFSADERKRYSQFLFDTVYEAVMKVQPSPEGWGLIPWNNFHIGSMSQGVIPIMALHGEPSLEPEKYEALRARAMYWFQVMASGNQETGWDGGQVESGYSYAMMNLAALIAQAAAWRSVTGQDPCPQLGYLRYLDAWLLYGLRPDYKLAKIGDGTAISARPLLEFGDGISCLSMATMAGMLRSPFLQWVVGQKEPSFFKLVFFDPSLPPSDPNVEPHLRQGDRLPLGRLFRAQGLVFSRSAWSPDATHLTFHCQDKVTWHLVGDCGQIQIYKGGPLIVDGGFRWENTLGDAYAYLKSTISKSTLTVYDPKQDLWMGSDSSALPNGLNVGGQVDFPFIGNEEMHYKNRRLQDRADLTAYENRPEYLYVSADITGAYTYHTLRHFNRQVVHIRPDTVVVFDRVTSKDPSFAKRLRFHTIHEPAVRGNEFVAHAGRGLLWGSCLLPASAVVTKDGGPGREYWVGEEAIRYRPAGKPDRSKGEYFLFEDANLNPIFGQWTRENKCTVKEGDAIWVRGERTWQAHAAEIAQWRIEVSPGQPAANDVFLHVFHMQIPAAANGSSPRMAWTASGAFAPERLKTYPVAKLACRSGMVGAEIKLPAGDTCCVLFSADGRPGGKIAIADLSGKVLVDQALADWIDRAPRR